MQELAVQRASRREGPGAHPLHQVLVHDLLWPQAQMWPYWNIRDHSWGGLPVASLGTVWSGFCEEAIPVIPAKKANTEDSPSQTIMAWPILCLTAVVCWAQLRETCRATSLTTWKAEKEKGCWLSHCHILSKGDKLIHPPGPQRSKIQFTYFKYRKI